MERRARANAFTADCSCSRFRSGNLHDGSIFFELYNLSVIFVFDEHDTVILMQFGGGG